MYFDMKIFTQEMSSGPFKDTNDFFWKNAVGQCYSQCASHKEFKKEQEELGKAYDPTCTEK